MKNILILILASICNDLLSQNSYYSTDSTKEYNADGSKLLMRNVITYSNKVFCTLIYVSQHDTIEMRFNECNFHFLHDSMIASKQSNYLLVALSSEPSDEQQYILLALYKRKMSICKFSIYNIKEKFSLLKDVLLDYSPLLRSEDPLLIDRLTKMLYLK